jgi:hypothetical protein
MDEMNEIAKTLGEAEGVDQSRELTDADLDKVAGGLNLGDITSKVNDKVARAQAKVAGFDTSGIDVAKITGIDPSDLSKLF